MQKAKRIFVLSLCLLLVLACSACRNNDGGETPQGDAKAGGEITVGIAADLTAPWTPISPPAPPAPAKCCSTCSKAW